MGRWGTNYCQSSSDVAILKWGRIMKHKWKPFGICEHKYCEARCEICGRREPRKISSSDWCDTEGLSKFWGQLIALDDCPGKKS